jgi:hypothetical protein
MHALILERTYQTETLINIFQIAFIILIYTRTPPSKSSQNLLFSTQFTSKNTPKKSTSTNGSSLTDFKLFIIFTHSICFPIILIFYQKSFYFLNIFHSYKLILLNILFTILFKSILKVPFNFT